MKDSRRDFDLAVFVLLLGWYLSFIGYMLFPAIGPRYTLAHLQSVPLNGNLIGDFVSHLINLVEGNKQDCMPSGHVAIALLVLFLSYRYARLLFYFFCPIVAALILSTVYLQVSLCHRSLRRSIVGGRVRPHRPSTLPLVGGGRRPGEERGWMKPGRLHENWNGENGIYTNDHFLADTTKDEKWLVLVGRPSLDAISVGGRRTPAPLHGGPPHRDIFI